jgi:simple sugar transport system ATP-binding protein
VTSFAPPSSQRRGKYKLFGLATESEELFVNVSRTGKAQMIPTETSSSVPDVPLGSSNTYLIQLHNVFKTFGHVSALNGVDFHVGYNEIVGLVGDNGAGKSTLIKILSGVHAPDKGQIYFRGKELKGYSASRSRDIGIETVYQEKALVEQQSLWRNIFLGREITNALGFLNIKKQKAEAARIIKEIGFTAEGLSPESIVETLSGGEKEGVAISRVIHFQAELVILDEPTVGLSLSEVQKVLDFVGQIKKRGKACVLITHNLYHVFPAADRLVILDRGKIAGEFTKKDITVEYLMDKLYSVAKSGKIAK